MKNNGIFWSGWDAWAIGKDDWAFNIVATNFVKAFIALGYDVRLEQGVGKFKKYEGERRSDDIAFRLTDVSAVQPGFRNFCYQVEGPGCFRGEHVRRLRQCEMLVFSNWEKYILAPLGIPKVEVFRPGVDKKIFYPRKKRLPGPVRFIFVGQNWRRKGLDAIIDVWDAKNMDGILVLKLSPTNVADYDYLMGRYNGELSANIELHYAHYTVEQMGDLYRSGDVFLGPARAHGAGLVALEALACGLPLISTRFGGQSDYMTEDNSWTVEGDFVPRNDGLLSGIWQEIDRTSLIECFQKTMVEPKKPKTKVWSWEDSVRCYMEGRDILEVIVNA